MAYVANEVIIVEIKRFIEWIDSERVSFSAKEYKSF